MRLLGRLYVIAASFAFGLLMGGAVFILAALWVAPEWAQDMGRQAARGLERLSGVTGGTVPAPLGGVTEVEEIGGASVSRCLPPAPGAVASGAAAPTGGVGGFETALRQMESDIAELRKGEKRPAAEGGNGNVEERLRAWESLRDPLFSLMASVAEADGTAAPALEGKSDIRRVAGVIAERLRRLADSIAVRDEQLLARVDPRTLVRVLADDESISDREAAAWLSYHSPARAAEMLERLSRVAPERAARVLRELAGRDAERGRDGEDPRVGMSARRAGASKGERG